MSTANTLCGHSRVCLLGGLATSDDIWKPLLNALPSDVEVLHLRMSDAQKALQDQQPLHISSIAKFFAEKLVSSPPAATHLIGFSLGSWIAQGVCLELPHSPRTLTLIGSSAHIYSHGISVVGEWIRAFDQIGFDAAVTGIYNWMFGSDMYEQIPKLKTYFKQSVKLSGVTPMLLKQQLEMAAAFVDGFDLSKIATPTLVMRGDSDILFPLHASKKLVRQIGGAKLVEVPKSGHAALIENSGFCVKAISEFIRENSLAANGSDRD